MTGRSNMKNQRTNSICEGQARARTQPQILVAINRPEVVKSCQWNCYLALLQVKKRSSTRKRWKNWQERITKTCLKYGNARKMPRNERSSWLKNKSIRTNKKSWTSAYATNYLKRKTTRTKKWTSIGKSRIPTWWMTTWMCTMCTYTLINTSKAWATTHTTK